MPIPHIPLAFDSKALEPHVDGRTMEIHHGKHHATYVTNLNNTILGKSVESWSLDDLIGKLAQVPEDIRTAVRNNGGGVINHNWFFEMMSPKGGGEPTGALADAVKRDFGSFSDFKAKFKEASLKRFGSGWAWLLKKDGKLVIASTPNQDNPLMGEAIAGVSGTPLLTLDVWEHAYYLNYQNRRADFVDAWWNVVNWSHVADRFKN
jgi:Fe-Mn family superoxide dismutase